ncbi:hypothetical protein ACXYMT_08275 [Salinimicrobium sp. CAU 1759]
MKTSQKVLSLFILLGVLFTIGSIFDFDLLELISTVFLIPVLILYYRYKARKWFLPMVIALLFFYIRDLFMINGFSNNAGPILLFFGGGLLILYIYALTSFPRAKAHPVEIFSLIIMYGFLGFLFYTIAELVPQVIPSYKNLTYIYLLVLTLLLAITFTQYLLKSHYASLWLMLASASLLVSEFSLFFRMYVISDISVIIFYPFFHVIAFYAMVEHALHRRRSRYLPGF